jgi:phage virion morphogenesis protein
MLEFTFSDTLSPRLAAAGRALVDFTPAMKTIADFMRSQAVLNFENETGPDGRKWQPSQRAIADGGLTLTDRGHLRQSITAASDATSAIAGTNLIYARIHQFGGRIQAKPGKALNTPFGPRGAVTMPARPFLGFSAGDVIAIENILGDHITRAFEGGAA